MVGTGSVFENSQSCKETRHREGHRSFFNKKYKIGINFSNYFEKIDQEALLSINYFFIIKLQQ